MIDKPDLPPGQAKKQQDEIAAVKRMVFSNSPAPSEAIDEIVRLAEAFDRAYANNDDIGFIAPDIIDTIWKACGSPVVGIEAA